MKRTLIAALAAFGMVAAPAVAATAAKADNAKPAKHAKVAKHAKTAKPAKSDSKPEISPPITAPHDVSHRSPPRACGAVY